MNSSTRVLLVSLLSVAALAGCSKKVKEAPVAETTPTAPTAPVADDGVYGPEDLDTDACLRQRVIHFDFDQYTVKPEYQAVIGKYPQLARWWGAVQNRASVTATAPKLG